MPASSAVVAVSLLEQLPMSPAPTSTTLDPGGGAGVTVTAAVPLLPSLVAVIGAEPAATPVTRPLPLTVATAVLPLAHVTTRPASGLPFASFGVAMSCTVAPTDTLGVGGVTVTDATGAGGVLDVIAKLHTVWEPTPAPKAQLARAVTPLCSLRNAKPVPIVSSVPP